MRETLDEAIDRVASTLTAVSAESRFAVRLDERRSRVPIWLMAATATSVLLATLLMNRPWDVQRPAIELPSKATATTAASSSPRTEPSIPIEASTSAASSATRHASRELEMPPAPTIAALTGPPSLSVDELRFESLTIAPVDVVHLEAVTGLELPALETMAPEEYR